MNRLYVVVIIREKLKIHFIYELYLNKMNRIKKYLFFFKFKLLENFSFYFLMKIEIKNYSMIYFLFYFLKKWT